MNQTPSAREIRSNYQQLLHSEKWLRFRSEQIEKSGNQCRSCDSQDVTLQVHHLVYRDVLPWDYKDQEVRVLCERCHKAVHLVADLVWVACLRFEPHELEIVLKRLKAAGDKTHLDHAEFVSMEDVVRGIFGVDITK